MEVVAYCLFSYQAINQNSEKRRPHIDKVETVEAVRNDQHISRQGGSIGVHLADVYDEIGKQTANRRVE